MTPPTESRFDSARAENRATACERSGGLLLAAAYVLINLWLAPGGFVPVHQDDYHVLGAGFDRMRLMVERPVSSNLAYAMGGLGAGVAFAVQNTMTVLVALGALAFLGGCFPCGSTGTRCCCLQRSPSTIRAPTGTEGIWASQAT